MSIATACEECGRDYSVKDEMAGKKFKCKECGAIVVVPSSRKSGGTSSVAKKRPPKKSDPDDEYGDTLDADDDNQDELRPPVSKRKPVTKKKKSARSSSGGTGLWAKIGGGIFTGLVVLGFIARLFKAAGGIGGDGVNWQEFRAPNGRYTVLFPAASKQKPQPDPGVSTFLGESRNFACAVTHAKLPPGTGALLGQLSPQMLSDQLIKEGYPGVQLITNRPATLGGLPSHETSFNKDGMRLTERSIIVGDELFNCEFISKSDPPAAEFQKFYESFRIVGAGAPAAAGAAMPGGAMPGGAMPGGPPVVPGAPGGPAAVPGGTSP